MTSSALHRNGTSEWVLRYLTTLFQW